MMSNNQNGSGVLKRFIRYLYEYEQGKRMRNVGFVKVEQGEDGCMVHIHGKGLRMGDDRSLQIYLLFEDDGRCFGIWQGEADNINPAVNECISYTVEDTGTPENYDKINGVALQNRDGRRYAALWDEKPMDLSDMRVWSSEDPKEEAETGTELLGDSTNTSEKDSGNFPKEGAGNVPAGARPEDVLSAEGRKTSDMASDRKREMPDIPTDRKREMPDMPTDRKQEMPEVSSDREQEMQDVPAVETVGQVQAVKDQEGTEDIAVTQGSDDLTDDFTDEIPSIRSEDFFFMEQPGNPRSQQRWRTRKIQRTELAKLARCEWRLANNNFLLHGYYNYHHLILLEKGDQLMLGVPGIYHEKEAAAAGAFGFPEFIEKDRLEVNLSPEEYNDEQPFGYWCRPVKRAFKWE